VIAFSGFLQIAEKVIEFVEVVEVLDHAIRDDLDALYARLDVCINPAIFWVMLAIADLIRVRF